MLRGTAGIPGYLTKFSDILVDLPGYTNWYTVFCSTQYPVPSRGDTKFSTTSRANLKFSTTAVPVELDLESTSRALQLHVTNFCTFVPYIQALYALCISNPVSLY
jgi:hypothetical protein